MLATDLHSKQQDFRNKQHKTLGYRKHAKSNSLGASSFSGKQKKKWE